MLCDNYWFYMEDFIMYEKYLEQLEEAGKIRNLKERSINCYKNYVSYFLKYHFIINFQLLNWIRKALGRRGDRILCVKD